VRQHDFVKLQLTLGSITRRLRNYDWKSLSRCPLDPQRLTWPRRSKRRPCCRLRSASTRYRFQSRDGTISPEPTETHRHACRRTSPVVACIVKPDIGYRQQQWQIRPYFCLQPAMGVVWKVDTVAHRNIPRSFILMKEVRPGWVWEMGVHNIADQVRWKDALRVCGGAVYLLGKTCSCARYTSLSLIRGASCFVFCRACLFKCTSETSWCNPMWLARMLAFIRKHVRCCCSFLGPARGRGQLCSGVSSRAV